MSFLFWYIYTWNELLALNVNYVNLGTVVNLLLIKFTQNYDKLTHLIHKCSAASALLL